MFGYSVTIDSLHIDQFYLDCLLLHCGNVIVIFHNYIGKLNLLYSILSISYLIVYNILVNFFNDIGELFSG